MSLPDWFRRRRQHGLCLYCQLSLLDYGPVITDAGYIVHRTCQDVVRAATAQAPAGSSEWVRTVETSLPWEVLTALQARARRTP